MPKTGMNVRRMVLGSSVVALSHPGGRSHNEDDFLVFRQGEVILLAVADGLGGHRAGEVASGIAIQTLERNATALTEETTDPEILIRDVFARVDTAIRARAHGPCEGMGTTLVTALIRGGKVTVVHTGDSRAYLIRDRLIMKTRDHSAVQDLVDRGLISEREARSHPFRHLITGALGIDTRVDSCTIPVQGGDTVLLASDGFYEAIDEDHLIALVRYEPFSSLADRLLDEVVERSSDNITIALARV
ncbi:MAG: protein phosphatase 2C domain-containing protein [Methanomicrobiales archaeon]|nr:protein phosphatase 2C domain-containing protein [Methanomicrobiales archaeon]